mmetsp:Transcript_42755/g.114431  ORF Transcript_42755/g.114431 Transcript_42755/m.114431 type:complete len:98 (-) Transcript_42755:172-465(-)
MQSSSLPNTDRTAAAQGLVPSLDDIAGDSSFSEQMAVLFTIFKANDLPISRPRIRMASPAKVPAKVGEGLPPPTRYVRRTMRSNNVSQDDMDKAASV